jgi:hypothetical protein
MEYKEEVISFNTIAICKKNIHRMYLTRNSNFEPTIRISIKDENNCNNLFHEIGFKNDFVAEEIFREVIKVFNNAKEDEFIILKDIIHPKKKYFNEKFLKTIDSDVYYKTLKEA